MTERPLADNAKVPQWCDWVLRLLVGRERFETISGDLLEEYRQVALPELGAPKARRWYLRQLFTYAGPLHIGLALGFVSSIAIVVSNVVLPLLHIDIESPNAEGVLTALCFGGSLLAWAVAGFLARRRASAFTASLRSGAIVAFAHIALVMLTFVVVNNLFLNIVSQQPDKIWGFEQSGAASMRAYVNHAALRGVCLVLPVAVALGAICGAAGGAFDIMRRHRQPSTR